MSSILSLSLPVGRQPICSNTALHCVVADAAGQTAVEPLYTEVYVPNRGVQQHVCPLHLKPPPPLLLLKLHLFLFDLILFFHSLAGPLVVVDPMRAEQIRTPPYPSTSPLSDPNPHPKVWLL